MWYYLSNDKIGDKVMITKEQYTALSLLEYSNESLPRSQFTSIKNYDSVLAALSNNNLVDANHKEIVAYYRITEKGRERLQEYEIQQRMVKISETTKTISYITMVIAIITLFVSIASCSKSASPVVYSDIFDSSGYHSSSQK